MRGEHRASLPGCAMIMMPRLIDARDGPLNGNSPSQRRIERRSILTAIDVVGSFPSVLQGEHFLDRAKIAAMAPMRSAFVLFSLAIARTPRKCAPVAIFADVGLIEPLRRRPSTM